MNKNLLSRTMLLLCALMAGSGMVWAADETYIQVTSVSDLDTDATYIIADVSESTVNAFGTLNNSKGTIISSDVSVSGTTITVKSSAASKPLEFKLAKSGDYYLISYGATPTYLTYNSGTNFATSTTAPTANGGKWNIVYDDTYNCLLINNVNTTARYILRNGTSAYGPYSNTNLSTYGKATLYKKEEASPLASISVDVTGAQTTFHQGDDFTHAGAIVTATYENGKTKVVTGDATFSTPDMSTLGTKSVTVSYTENEVEKTTSYNITVNAPAALTGITLSGEYNTEFKQDDTFSHDGLIVTAHYDDETSKDVTANAVVAAPDMSTTGTKSVTVSYTENEVTKSTSYSITITEFVQPMSPAITLNNSFFGSTATSNVDNATLNGSQDNIKVTINKNDGNKLYVNAGQIRLYSKNTMVVKVEKAGYVLTSIEFVEPSTGKAWDGNHTSSPTGYTSSTKTWTGAADEVTITFAGTCRIAGINVKLAKLATVTLAAACTDGEKYFGTYSNDKAFVVPADLTVSAIKVTDGVLAVTDYSTGDVVKAGTGVMVSSATAGDHTVVLTEAVGTEQEGNMLKASSVAMTGSNLFYRLTMHNGETIGFWWGAVDGGVFSIAENKAYLAVPADAQGAPGFLWFGGETTNIGQAVKGAETKDQRFFNLNGQRVSQPAKGLYIVNGRKVVVK